MYWNQKDTLDLLVMIAGAIIGGVVALCVLQLDLVTSVSPELAVPGCAVLCAYAARWAAWKRGLRKRF